MIGGFPLLELVTEEIKERQQEGCAVPDYTERLSTADEAELLKIYDELDALSVRADFPYEEPDGLQSILSASTGCTYNAQPDKDKLFDYLHGAWLGRIVGCVMGKPLEISPFTAGDENLSGWEYIKAWQEGSGEAFPPTNYIRGDSSIKTDKVRSFCEKSQQGKVSFAESDDDIRYLVLGLLLNEKYGNLYTAVDVADLWHRYLPMSMVFTAEYVAMRNSFNCTAKKPEEQIAYCHGYHNPFREWIGAQIRIDHYAYFNAGNPLAAAKAAFHDADFTHTKNGVYGAMFFAALIASAFTEKNIRNCIEIALSVIPKKSRLYADILFAVETAKNAESTEEIYRKLWDRFKGYSCVHTNNNAAACVAALVCSEGDYLKAVSVAVGAGWDTDCNGATVGSFMGALLGVDAIPAKLREPLHDTLYSSIPDFHPISIKACAERTYALINRKSSLPRRILEIWEDDFGCEGVPEDGEVMVKLLLETQDGGKELLSVPDALATELRLREGDRVLVDAEGNVQRVK